VNLRTKARFGVYQPFQAFNNGQQTCPDASIGLIFGPIDRAAVLVQTARYQRFLPGWRQQRSFELIITSTRWRMATSQASRLSSAPQCRERPLMPRHISVAINSSSEGFQRLTLKIKRRQVRK
jgi:hypothetical protein